MVRTQTNKLRNSVRVDMFSRKFRYRKGGWGGFYVQTRVWWWPFWCDEPGLSWVFLVKAWAPRPTSEWQYIDMKDMKPYV